MKLLCLADLHLGKTLSGYNLIEDQKVVLEQVKDYLKKEDVKILVLAGDIYDKAIASLEAINLFNSFITCVIKELGVKVYLISGNHDSGIRLASGKELLKESGLIIENKATCPINYYEEDNIRIYLLPYITRFNNASDTPFATLEEAYIDLLDKTILDKSKFNILVAHTTVLDKLTLYSDSEELREFKGNIEGVSPKIFKDFNLVLMGHLHTPQTIGNIIYAGSILKYSLSEVNAPKSALLIDVDSNNLSKIVQLPLKPIRDLKIKEGYFNELLSEEASEDFVHFRLLDEEIIIDAVNILKIKFPNTLSLEYVNKKIDNKSLDDLKEFKSLSKEDKILSFFEANLELGLNDSLEAIIKNILEEDESETN